MGLLPKGGVGVEVGAHKGRFTEVLREIAAPKALTLVDPWEIQEDHKNRPFAFEQRNARLEQFYQHLSETYAHDDRITLCRDTSANALPTFQDGSLDWVFLDGLKYYREMTADLETCVAKVRPGGVIAGGGFFWAKVLGLPVRTAVKDIVARIPGATLVQKGQFWAIQLPEQVVLNAPDRPESFLIISTMKNEAPYILEWIAHHRAIGFTDFLVFTNDCEDTTDPLLDRLEKLGGLTHQVNIVLKRGPHKSALKYAKDHVLTAKADWILICDVDEFINIRSDDGTIQGMMKRLGSETDVVPFPWKVFGHGGVVDFVDKPLTQQFVHCEPSKGGRDFRDVKTMFRDPERMYHFGLHRPRVREDMKPQTIWKSPSGEDISERMNKGQNWMMKWAGCADTAYMHHYPVRSVESYILKKNRGRANHVNEDLGMEYWNKWDMSGGTDRTLRRGHPKFAEELEKLMADKSLRALHLEGVQWHRDQFTTLVEDPKYMELYETLKAQSAGKDVA